MGVLRKIRKRIFDPFLQLWTKKFLSKRRLWKYRGLEFSIPPGVFHPGLFVSTKVFIDFLFGCDFSNQKVLDVGSGSGALAISAAKKGGIVHAVDLSIHAVEATQINAKRNAVKLKVIQSNLFESISNDEFDIILINPPFYPRKAENLEEKAWFCGEDFEYFKQLFEAMPDRLSPTGRCWMVLSEDCDLDKIQSIAASFFLQSTCIHTKVNWAEEIYIYEFARLTNDR